MHVRCPPPTDTSQWWHQLMKQLPLALCYTFVLFYTFRGNTAIKCVCNELHKGKLQLSAPGAKNHGFDNEECVHGPHEPFPVPLAAMHSRY